MTTSFQLPMAETTVALIDVRRGQAGDVDALCKHQWLPNGNLLLTESTSGRAFEIDRDVVWQYSNRHNDEVLVGLLDQAERLPPDFDRVFFEERREACSAPS